MKITGAAIFFLAFEGASAFLGQAPRAPAFTSLNSSPDAYTYSYGGNTVRDGSANTNGNTSSQSSSSTDDSRVKALEKALETRLASLAQQEKNLERRLSALERNPGRGASPSARGFTTGAKSINEIWETSKQTTVQGGSLRTWSFANPSIERVHVLLKTDGRPLDADVELWQGPDNTPHKMKVYVEDGAARTFSAFIDTPRSPNTIAIRNTGHLEFPLAACVGPDQEAGDACLEVVQDAKRETIQGGALRTYPFDPNVDSVAILLRTDGRPLNARIELLQGPNNNKQVLELYTEDGMDRPFFAIIQTPGSGNVVRVVNTAPVEFPMTASVVAYEMGNGDGWDRDGVMLGREW